jgi:hypothetical protein
MVDIDDNYLDKIVRFAGPPLPISHFLGKCKKDKMSGCIYFDCERG